ncbi:MAG: hypothetical protein HY238_02570 [Acidobacteria bacterium]|nr:hypothetical protein [Acidobacteriota bacterium]
MLLPTVFSVLLAAQGVPDGRAFRATLKTAERATDDRIQQMTSRTPFALLGNTRGAYLSGYGAVFTLEVNLVPVAAISPFRPPYSPPEIKTLNQQKREKLASLRAAIRQLLIEQAGVLTLVPPAEKIAIVVTLFNFSWEDTTGLPSQVVMQASRQTLLDLQARRAGPDAQERAIEVRDF